MEKISLMITFISKEPAEPSTTLLRGLFPACPACAEPGWEVLVPATGVAIQLCGIGAQVPAFLSGAHQPIISYSVNDFAKAIELATSQGAVILQQAIDDCTGFSFCYLRLSDEQVIGFFRDGNNVTNNK